MAESTAAKIKKLEEVVAQITKAKAKLEKEIADHDAKIAALTEAKGKKQDEIHEAKKQMLEKKKAAVADQLTYLTEFYDNEIKPEIQKFCDALQGYFEGAEPEN